MSSTYATPKDLREQTPVLARRLDSQGRIQLSEAAKLAGWESGMVIRVEVSDRGVVRLRPWKGRGHDGDRPHFHQGRLLIPEWARSLADLAPKSPVLVMVGKQRKYIFVAGGGAAFGQGTEDS